MTGPSGFRFRETSLGSAIQTGLTEGEFRITSGFIQRTGGADEVEPLVGDFNGDGEVDLMIFSFSQRLSDRRIRSLTSIGTEKSILTISLFSPETSGIRAVKDRVGTGPDGGESIPFSLEVADPTHCPKPNAPFVSHDGLHPFVYEAVGLRKAPPHPSLRG